MLAMKTHASADAMVRSKPFANLSQLRDDLFRTVSLSGHFLSPPSARKPYLR
jgi:cytochrome oxidase assembly protein ShyY1